jgi:hypothetical protein
LYSSSDIIRVIKLRIIRWAGHAARIGERRGAYRGLVGKPEGKNKRRWEDNIEMGLQEVGCEGLNWIGLIWRRTGIIGGFL